MELLRGDIIIANLEPVVGSEQKGIRPVLVIQNNLGNKYSPTTIIAPITSSNMDSEYPTNVFLSKEDSKLEKDSTILLNQIRTIDKKRLIKKISSLDTHLMKKTDLAIKVSLNLG
ncbi:MAG: type II toxin-antitoxin system PemK/MazF family toxin [Nanoarchaeota archaeon]